MKTLRFLLFTLLLPGVSFAQAVRSIAPQTVTIPCGNLHLKGSLWKPDGRGPFPAVLFNHGSGGTDAAHTAGMTFTEAAENLGPVFAKHGYAFLYLFRRGQGLSSDQAPFMGDVLQREETAKGTAASQHLRLVLLTTDYLDDVMAALAFLKSVPGIDPHRIAVAGHSFGGQLTLLAIERDTTVRAAVAFGGAALTWERSSEVRERLLTAVRKASAPVMFIQAANDYSTTPSRAMADELERLHKPYVLKIYPPIGQTPDDGHNAVYKAIPEWESDVFKFLDEYVRPMT